MTGVPTRADVAQLFDADQHIRHLRSWWVLIWTGDRWLLVYDPPSTTIERGHRRR